MPGFIEARGEWEYRTMTLTATSDLSQGTAVCIAAARTVSEYSGGQAGILGFLKHPSVNSLPAGQVIVAIPKAGCTALADIPSGIAASSLSLGEAYGIYKVGGVTSYLTTAAYSDASRVISIVGPYNSTTSKVEVQFLSEAFQFYSDDSMPVG